ncbi:MAG: hypothetical protein PVF70_14170 [Anaerolineales bacterium]
MNHTKYYPTRIEIAWQETPAHPIKRAKITRLMSCFLMLDTGQPLLLGSPLKLRSTTPIADQDGYYLQYQVGHPHCMPFSTPIKRVKIKPSDKHENRMGPQVAFPNAGSWCSFGAVGFHTMDSMDSFVPYPVHCVDPIDTMDTRGHNGLFLHFSYAEAVAWFGGQLADGCRIAAGDFCEISAACCSACSAHSGNPHMRGFSIPYARIYLHVVIRINQGGFNNDFLAAGIE